MLFSRKDSRNPEALERRTRARLDKVFRVYLEGEHGMGLGIARNISEGGMFVELADPLPLGSPIRIHFTLPDAPDEIVAHAEVKGHYFLNYSEGDDTRAMTGMGVRFVGFDDGDLLAPLRRTLH
jgi:PilZ domain